MNLTDIMLSKKPDTIGLILYDFIYIKIEMRVRTRDSGSPWGAVTRSGHERVSGPWQYSILGAFHLPKKIFSNLQACYQAFLAAKY